MPQLTNLLRRSRRVAAVAAMAAPVLAIALAVGASAAPASAGVTPTCQWQTLNLINGWRSAQSQWGTGDPSYCVSNGMVYLSGSMSQPVNKGDEFAVLPQNASPNHTLYFTVYTMNGVSGTMQINTDGSMQAYYGAAGQFTSLVGVSFPVPDTGTALQLIDGWQSGQGTWGTGDPSFTVSGGIVHLSGSLIHSNTDWGPFAYLPAADAPAYAMTFKVYSYAGAVGTVYAYPDGQLWAESASSGAADKFTSLAGISIPTAAATGASGHALNVLYNWTVPQTAAATGPSWYVSDGVVHLYGYLYVTGTSSEFAVLPQNLWPTHTLYFIATYDNVSTAALEIDTNGVMYAFNLPPGASSTDDFALDGISYHSGS